MNIRNTLIAIGVITLGLGPLGLGALGLSPVDLSGLGLRDAYTQVPSAPYQASATHVSEPMRRTGYSRDPELEHMVELMAKLKQEIPTIQDPAARQVAENNLDLWQHMFDRMVA